MTASESLKFCYLPRYNSIEPLCIEILMLKEEVSELKTLKFLDWELLKISGKVNPGYKKIGILRCSTSANIVTLES